MIRICVIGVYFGYFPNYFNLWLRSCELNPSVDFYIVTDNKVDSLPVNVKIISMKLPDMKKMAEEKLGMEISLETPYKCCDYKPVYGLIFEDYIKEYDYWGHCDFDMLFGDLRYFFDKYQIEKYDKFLPLGHLSFFRNTDECNQRFRIEPKKGNSYKKSFTAAQTTQFDELGGINSIYVQEGFPFFKKRIFVDISINWDRIKCAEGYIDPLDSSMNSDDKNYRYQIFAWANGKVKRFYIEKDGTHEEEFAYIHVKKRKFKELDFDAKTAMCVYICPHKFVEADSKKKITKKHIQIFNHYYGRVYEYFESKFLRKVAARIKKKFMSS